MRAIAVLGIVAALGGIGCASTAAATKGEERYPASVQSGLALSDEVIVEQLLRMMGGERVEALRAGKPVKLSPIEAVLLAEIYATYGSKSAAREALRAAQPASQPSIELVAVPTGDSSANGERTARR